MTQIEQDATMTHDDTTHDRKASLEPGGGVMFPEGGNHDAHPLDRLRPGVAKNTTDACSQ